MSTSDVSVSIKADLSEYQDAVTRACVEILVATGVDPEEAAEMVRQWGEYWTCPDTEVEAAQTRWNATVERYGPGWLEVVEAAIDAENRKIAARHRPTRWVITGMPDGAVLPAGWIERARAKLEAGPPQDLIDRYAPEATAEAGEP